MGGTCTEMDRGKASALGQPGTKLLDLHSMSMSMSMSTSMSMSMSMCKSSSEQCEQQRIAEHDPPQCAPGTSFLVRSSACVCANLGVNAVARGATDGLTALDSSLIVPHAPGTG